MMMNPEITPLSLMVMTTVTYCSYAQAQTISQILFRPQVAQQCLAFCKEEKFFHVSGISALQRCNSITVFKPLSFFQDTLLRKHGIQVDPEG